MRARENMNDLRESARRVEVEWVDSASNSEWESEYDVLLDAERADEQLCCSIGYVILDTDEKLVIVQSFSAQPEGKRNVSAALSIPAAAIRAIKELRR